MAMIREYPTVQIPPLSPDQNPTSLSLSPSSPYFSSLHRFLPSNTSPDDLSSFSSDDFRMYDFKVRRCSRARSHDWTDCPFAHPGEKARRRDPRLYPYSGVSCPEFRKGGCKRGDSCEFAHGVFECWLHPSRYRTQPCKDGSRCPRRVCFFAHSPDQLRVSSAPDSPTGELVAGLRGLQISWGGPARLFDTWNVFSAAEEEEPAMERVESGKNLRAAMYAKLRRDNALDRAEPVPDFGWVSELVK